MSRPFLCFLTFPSSCKPKYRSKKQRLLFAIHRRWELPIGRYQKQRKPEEYYCHVHPATGYSTCRSHTCRASRRLSITHCWRLCFSYKSNTWSELAAGIPEYIFFNSKDNVLQFIGENGFLLQWLLIGEYLRVVRVVRRFNLVYLAGGNGKRYQTRNTFHLLSRNCSGLPGMEQLGLRDIVDN